MPTTTVRTPDGQTVTVQHPEGASENEIISYAQQNYKATAPPTALSMQKTPSMFQQAMGGATRGAAEALMKVPVSQAELGEYGTSVLPEGVMPTGQTTEDMRRFLANIIPQTEVQAGAMAGAGGAGGLAAKLGLRGIAPALTRILGGAAGGGVGGAIGGEGAGRGTAQGGAAAAFAELLGWAIPKTLRSAPGGRGRIMRQDAAALGEQVGKVSPELAGAKTPEELQKLALGMEGKKGLYRIWDDFKQALGSDPDVIVPAVSDKPMPFSQAHRELSEIGKRGYGGAKADPTARTIAGYDERRLYEQGLDDLRLQLMDPGIVGPGAPPDLAARFDAARDAYSKGLTMLRMLRRPGAFEGAGRTTPVLNMTPIQEYLSQNRADVAQRLGAPAFEELTQSALRGGKLGTTDRPPSFVLRDIFKRKYAGAQQPYTLSPLQQTLADVASERYGEETAPAAAIGAIRGYEALRHVPEWIIRQPLYMR